MFVFKDYCYNEKGNSICGPDGNIFNGVPIEFMVCCNDIANGNLSRT